jgi:glycerophosphoryl diester phosphodiesterase
VGELYYTNSREALDENYARGHRVFELDFCWTSDNHLVLIHDWGQAWAEMFENDGTVPTLEAFERAPSRRGLSQLTLAGLVAWLEVHPGALVVTDVKERNLDALQQLSTLAPELRDRFLPQIYRPEEYRYARELGFRRIVFSVYRSSMNDRQIVEFASAHPLWALTISEHVAQHFDLSELLARGAPPIFVHTINDAAVFDALLARGFHGVYTDRLAE